MLKYFTFIALFRINAAVIQLVECDLAKVDVVGSNPIRRSIFTVVFKVVNFQIGGSCL